MNIRVFSSHQKIVQRHPPEVNNPEISLDFRGFSLPSRPSMSISARWHPSNSRVQIETYEI